MNPTNINLTPIEKDYANRQFKKIHNSINWLWIVYLIIIIFGIGFTFSDFPLLGVPFIFIGIFGAVFFNNNSYQTKLELQETTYIHTGRLKSKLIRIGTHYINVYHLDHYVLILPTALETYISYLEDKYCSAPVTITFATLKIRKQDITETVYTPLIIENDLCINKAIEKYGRNFLFKDLIYSYRQPLAFIAIFMFIFFLVYSIIEQFDFGESIFTVGILFPSSFFLALYIVVKLFNNKKTEKDQRGRFKC